MAVATFDAARTGTPWRLILGGCAAAVILGVALRARGPDPGFLPDMAPSPVILPDSRALYVQCREVTVAQWNRCAQAGACTLTLTVASGQDPFTTPATGLSFVGVQAYPLWINQKTRWAFRLPTAAEWQAMAAAVLPEAPDPLFTDPALSWASSYLVEGLAPRALKAQGSFSTSPEGVVDLDGSIWEWIMECYDGTIGAASVDHCPALLRGQRAPDRNALPGS